MLTKHWMKTGSLIAAMGLFAGTAVAQVRVDVDAERQPTRQEVRQQDDVRANQTARRMMAHHLQADKIIGMEVKNADGKSIGEIEDLVVRTDSGDIAYAALSFGGFLDIGDKLFAVPWKSLHVKARGENNDDTYLVFNIDKTRLENAPVFDQRDRPDVANSAWQKSIDDFYQDDVPAINNRSDNDRPRATDRNTDDRGVEVDVNRNGISVRTNGANDNIVRDDQPNRLREGKLATNPHAMRVSELDDLDIQNAAQKELGSIDDVVIDTQRGRIDYAVVSFGGFLGFGDKLVAVPWKSMMVKQRDDDHVLVLNIEEPLLKKAPTLGDDGYASFNNKAYVDEVNQFFAQVNTRRGADVDVDVNTTQRPETRDDIRR
ncbi:MAG: PRC-barrel domain-containing protein [Planctomycetales bacterium]|nr:PRC-barrel domain-containing protein [Planctomycetales bacterium]